MIKIGEIFNIEKGTLQSSKCTPGEFDFITASEEWKTHVRYTHDCEALVFAMGASGSLGRTHYVNGKFIASDLCFILTPKTKYKENINLRFYFYYFNTFRAQIVRDTATGTSKLAINRKTFANYKIHLTNIEKQTNLLNHLEAVQQLVDKTLAEVNHQQRFISLLRQSILQQAIEGKLCRHVNTHADGNELLKLILAEKEPKMPQHIPVREEEKAFGIPTNWAWSRLGDLILSAKDGPHYSPKYQSAGIPFISGRNITANGIDFTTAKYISKELHEELSKRCKPAYGDVLYTKGGDTGHAVVNDTTADFNVWVHVAVLKPSKYVLSQYIALALNSPHCYTLSQKYTHGTGNRDLGLTRMVLITIPLPPLEEQEQIVNKVTELMHLCNQLEKENQCAQESAEGLMKALFNEAFSVSENNISTKSNIMPFAVRKSQSNEDLLAAARGNIRQDTWDHLRKRALELTSEE